MRLASTTSLTIIAFLAFVSLGLPDGVLGVAWPSVRRSFDLPLSQLGVLLATSMVGYLASTASTGELMRRLGVGRLLLVSSLTVVASLAGYALAPAWWVMVGCGVLAGLGAGAIDAGINTYAAHHFKPRVVTWLHASYGVGATLGPLTMTAVLAGGLHWRYGYAIIGSALLAMSVIFILTRDAWGSADEGSGADNVTAVAGPVETLRQPLAWVHVLLFFVYAGVEITAGQWLYTLFTERRDMATSLAGIAVGLFWGGLTGGRVGFGILAHYVRRRTLLRVGLLLVPLSVLILLFDRQNRFVLLATPLLGIGCAPIYPLLISATPDRLGPRYAQQVVGFQVSAAYLGGAALPGLAGVLARYKGLETIPLILLINALALLALHEIAARMNAIGNPALSAADPAPSGGGAAAEVRA